MELKQSVWVIMTGDGKQIAKSRYRERFFVDVNDVNNKYEFLTYSSKARAEARFPKHGGEYKAVECELVTRLVIKQ